MLENYSLLLAVDFGDVIGIVIFLVMAGASLASQFGGQKKPAGRPPRQPPRGNQPAAAPRPANVDQEIEQFLREAQNRGKPPRAPQRQPAQQQPIQQQPAQQQLPTRKRPGRPQRPAPPGGQRGPADQRPRRQAPPVQAEVVDAGTFRGSVSEHVAQHLNSHPLSEHTARLGADLAQADERMEGHLHTVFDHTVGGLARQETSESHVDEGTDAGYWQERKQAVTPAMMLREMLADPANVRQAIILAEVLRRPEDRWE